MGVLIRAVVVGMLIMLAGTLPRNIAFALNLKYWSSVPWSVPLIAAWMWVFWRYLGGSLLPDEGSARRRASLRAIPISRRQWIIALSGGVAGIVALVFALRLVNRMVMLPQQTLPDLSAVPRLTVFSLLIAAAPVAGIVEEAAFRGYMQSAIERRFGLLVAILVTGTMFAVAHLDFTLVLWPYYVAVAALYGTITYLTRSILPATVLHTLGNTYSNLDLLLTGHAEWQAAASPAALVWSTGADEGFWWSMAALLVSGAAAGALLRLLATDQTSTRM